MAHHKSVMRSRKSVSRPKKALSRKSVSRKSPKKARSQKSSSRKSPKKSGSRKSRRSYRFSEFSNDFSNELPFELPEFQAELNQNQLVDKLMRQLKEIKKVSIVKNEINNLIDEIPIFLLLSENSDKRRNAISVAERRLEDLQETWRIFNHFEKNMKRKAQARLEKIEAKKEERGEKRTYPEAYFYDGSYEQKELMDNLGIGSEWPKHIRKDLGDLVFVYKNLIEMEDVVHATKKIYLESQIPTRLE